MHEHRARRALGLVLASGATFALPAGAWRKTVQQKAIDRANAVRPAIVNEETGRIRLEPKLDELAGLVLATLDNVSGKDSTLVLTLYLELHSSYEQFKFVLRSAHCRTMDPSKKRSSDEYEAIDRTWRWLNMQYGAILVHRDALIGLCEGFKIRTQRVTQKLDDQRDRMITLTRVSLQVAAMGFFCLDEDFQDESPTRFGEIQSAIDAHQYDTALRLLNEFCEEYDALHKATAGLPSRRNAMVADAARLRRKLYPIKIALTGAKAEIKALERTSSASYMEPLTEWLDELCAQRDEWTAKIDEALHALSMGVQDWDAAKRLLDEATTMYAEIVDGCKALQAEAKRIRSYATIVINGPLMVGTRRDGPLVTYRRLAALSSSAVVDNK
jgi:hypothetical protein